MNTTGSSLTNNPVPALIARRTTVLAPPSLSTINHLDGATVPVGRNAGSPSLRAAPDRRHVGSQTLPRISHSHHRSDLQQAVSQATAAVPVSTRENISTSKSWSSGLALKNANYPTARTSNTHHEFVLHPTFRSDAEHRGDVLVRVEGVDFFVHKHVLLFSSPFFASVLLGEWKESRLSQLLQDETSVDAVDEQDVHIDSAAESEATASENTAACNVDSQSDHNTARTSNNASPSMRDVQLQANSAAPPESVGMHLKPASATLFTSAESGQGQDPEHLGSDDRRRSLLRASYHTALWSQEDAASSSSSLGHSTGAAASPAEDGPSTADGTDDESEADCSDASEAKVEDDAAPRSEGAEVALSERKKDVTGLRKVRSKSKHLAARLTLRKLESASKSQTIPTRSTSKSLSSLVTAAADPAEASTPDERAADRARASPLARLESLATPPLSRRTSQERMDAVPVDEASVASNSPADQAARGASAAEVAGGRLGAGRGARRYRGVVAVVELEEEAAGTFHDFLFHIYPHLDLAVTWWNCGHLLRFSDKFQVPYLRRSCVSFLRAALAGRPIEAMRLAELHGMDDLYKEASRHVLDNFAAWEPEELECLSKETLLKLERKRTWFLERLLKLGLANPARDYECHASCADPQTCARLLHEKWQSAYANAFRFSPPQPSVIFRHLRELDNASVLHMSACQSAARSWVQGLFDRMFSLGTLHTPRQFLAVKLEPPPTKPSTSLT